MWSGHRDSVPDCWEVYEKMRGRFPVGAGQLHNSGVPLGDINPLYRVRDTITGSSQGRNQVALTIEEMPRHNHERILHGNSLHGNLIDVVGASPGGSGAQSSYLRATHADGGGGVNFLANNRPRTSWTGGIGTANQNAIGAPHENRPPFYAVYFIRKTSNVCN
jgi:microcystin-dependent protein